MYRNRLSSEQHPKPYYGFAVVAPEERERRVVEMQALYAGVCIVPGRKRGPKKRSMTRARQTASHLVHTQALAGSTPAPATLSSCGEGVVQSHGRQ